MMKFTKVYTVFFVLFSVVLGMQSAFAQTDWVEDPLKKASIWKELKTKPTNVKLWESYFGKSIANMSGKERQQFNEWKQELMIRKLAENEAVVGFVVDAKTNEDLFIDEAAFNEIESRIQEALTSGEISVSVADFAGLEAMILLEGDEVKNLKKNVIQNFVILEDIYADRFAEYNIEYKYYHDTHPDKKYDLIKWIDDQDNKLHELKMKEINELKGKYHVGENKN